MCTKYQQNLFTKAQIIQIFTICICRLGPTDRDNFDLLVLKHFFIH